MSSQAPHRVPAIDVAKGIGILLVVLGHNPVFRENAHAAYEAVYLFHMPLFFFLSGLTLRRAPVLDTLGRRARGLLVPYFAMSAVAVFLAFHDGGASRGLAELAGVLHATGHTIRFVPLWFLPCLFLATMGVALAQPLTRSGTSLAVLGSIGLVVGTALLESDVSLPPGLAWSADLVPFAVAMMLFGFLASGRSWIGNWRQPVLTILGAGCVLGILVANGTSLDLNARRMTGVVAVFTGIAAGTSLVLALSTVISRSAVATRLFAYLGSASLVILMLHSPLQRRLADALLAARVDDVAVVAVSFTVTVVFICALDLLVLRQVRAIGWFVYPRRMGEVKG